MTVNGKIKECEDCIEWDIQNKRCRCKICKELMLSQIRQYEKENN